MTHVPENGSIYGTGFWRVCHWYYRGDKNLKKLAPRISTRNLHRIERCSIWCKFLVPETFKHSRPIKLHNFGHLNRCKFLARVSWTCVIALSLLQKRCVKNELRLSVRSIERQMGNITMPTWFDSYPDFLAVALLLLITLLVSVGVKVICLVYFMRIKNSVYCSIKTKIHYTSFPVASP